MSHSSTNDIAPTSLRITRAGDSWPLSVLILAVTTERSYHTRRSPRRSASGAGPIEAILAGQ